MGLHVRAPPASGLALHLRGEENVWFAEKFASSFRSQRGGDQNNGRVLGRAGGLVVGCEHNGKQQLAGNQLLPLLSELMAHCQEEEVGGESSSGRDLSPNGERDTHTGTRSTSCTRSIRDG